MKQENDPVLAAIAVEEGERCGYVSLYKVRHAYLDFKVAHDSWIERTNRVLESHNADRVADKQRIADLEASGEHIFCSLMEARKRIAELEANNEKLGKTSLSVQFDFLKDMETDRSKRIAELEDRLVDANKTIEALKKQTSTLDLNQKPF